MKRVVFIILIVLSFFGFLVLIGTLTGWFYLSKMVKIGNPIQNLSAVSALCKYQDGVSYLKYAENMASWEPNNKVGIYVYAEEKDFFELAQNLVNSSGGSWGYVLIPYNMDDRDNDKWERVFEQLSAKKLIPIVQLWNLDLDKYVDQTKDSAKFLNKFTWPIKNRYIAVYNEPNDAAFWYGKLDPESYAKILDYTIEKFKNVNNDFFMMNAGFNASAPNKGNYMDEFDYLKKMNEYVPGIFSKLDGWTSHSYPQPNFSGNPKATGRWSIKAYDTELDFLHKVLGVNKELPVFITETGWAHAEGETYDSSYLPAETVAEFFRTAYKEVWLPDPRVRAVTPFTIWYEKPYDHFSWVNQDKVPYEVYNVIKSMKKVKGKPPTLKQHSLMLNVCNVQN